MTDHHLDDEQLSGVLDGDAPPPHLDGCPDCAGRLDARRAAQALAATPVEPLDDLTRRRLVSRAVDAALGEAPEGARPSPRGTRRAGVRPAWWQRPVFAGAGIAAALALAIGSVAVIRSGGSGDELSAVDEAMGLDPSVIAGDLGSLDDPASIRAALGAAESGVAYSRAPAAGSADSDAVGGAGSGGISSGGGSGGFVVSGGGDSDDGGTVAPEERSDAFAGSDSAANGQTRTQAARAVTAGDVDAIRRCIVTSSAEGLTDGDLALAATGTFGGQQVVLLAYRNGAGQVLALLLDRSSCEIVSALSF